MRPDMSRVVIERERSGSWMSYHLVREHDIAHRDLDRLALLPHEEGMRAPHKKAGDYKMFSDVLGPLHGFLIKSVGRPWNKVHAEICEQISASSTTQIHVLSHIDQFVEIHTTLGPDGKTYPKPASNWRHRYRLKGNAFEDGWDGQLYVHPITGILRRAPERAKPWRGKKPLQEKTFRRIAPERELHQVNGIWYWAVFDTARPRSMFDPAMSRWPHYVVHPTDYFTQKPVETGKRYRVGKRQASGRDLRKYALTNVPMEDSDAV